MPLLEQQEAYWQRLFRGDLPVSKLWSDHPRPLVSSYIRGVEDASLSPDLYRQLQSTCAREQVSLFVLFLAAFKTLLYRHTGQEDVIVGVPSSDSIRWKEDKGGETFSNLLALRSDLTRDPSFAQLLTRMAKTVQDASENRDYPFENLIEQYGGVGVSSIFGFCDGRPTVSIAPITERCLLDLERYSNKSDLVVLVNRQGDSVALQCQYDTELFEPATIARLLGHYETLLEGIVADPNQRISDLSLLTNAEKHQLLIEWNDTKTDYPKDKCIHQLFEEQVERTPDAIALVYEDQQLTYRELNNRANQLAHYLHRQGVQRDTLVALCMERSIEMIVGLLGILKVGGAYVPLDPSYPKERLGFMLEDTQAGIVLTDTASRNRLPPASARIIGLDRDWEEFAKEPKVNPISQSTAINLAYVIYTSGSTGVPKGIEVRHRGVVRLLFGVDYVQVDTTRTFLHLAPISFDAATFEVWGSLLHGGKCVLFPGKVPSAKELGEVLKKHQATTLWLAAALFNTVINEEPQALSEVKQLLIGGEALTVRHVKKGLAELPNTEIINGYGPTESTTFTCCYPIPRQLDDNLSSIPIGKPIGNTQVYIFDSHLNPVPIGVPGELHIGGDGLARGYFNRPELTAEKFIANPFSNEPEARLYKTGDLARYLADGNIEYLGRIDNQVKIRGFRIELGEIETVLAQHPAIQQAVVLAREDSPGDKQLVAYAVTAAGSAPSAHDLRGFLQQKLPDYMVPSAFMFLDSLPLTPNGKLDRKALPAPDQSRPELEDAFAAARTPVEEILANIWAEVLKLDKVGIHDNFFHLGGHSLLAIKLITRIRDTFQLDLPLGSLFEAPTIDGLAPKLQELGNKPDVVQEEKITRFGREQYRVQRTKSKA